MTTVDINLLDSPAVQDYLSNSDRRILAGARFILEALNIPYPDYLKRKPAGRPLAQRILADYRRDIPETLHEYTMRKSREAASRLPSSACSDPLASAPIDTAFLG